MRTWNITPRNTRFFWSPSFLEKRTRSLDPGSWTGDPIVFFFWHMAGNKFLSLLSNIFTDLNLTDIETGYKVFKAPLIKSIQIEEDRFGVEPEIVAKLARTGCRIYEVGISYSGSTYREGKKI